jgi:hypothetical protein
VFTNAMQHTFGSPDAEVPFRISHFIGGPCEEEQVAAALIFTESRCILIQDKDCLRRGLSAANCIAIDGEDALQEEGRANTTAPWFRELSHLQRSPDACADDEEHASQVDEPAAKRQKQAIESVGGISSTPPFDDTAPDKPSTNSNVHLLVLWGYAGWSRCQLMGEIARGSWGLCRALPEDVFQQAPSDLWQAAYPRLIFAPKNEMSESYGGQVPEEEERRRQLRQMAIFHEIIHGRGHLSSQRSPMPEPEEVAEAADEEHLEVDLDSIDDEAMEHIAARVESLAELDSSDSEDNGDEDEEEEAVDENDEEEEVEES